MRDGLHRSVKGADVFPNGLNRAVDSGLSNMRCLNLTDRGIVKSRREASSSR